MHQKADSLVHSDSLASVAQLVEHPTDTRAVVGSTPTACTAGTNKNATPAFLFVVEDAWREVYLPLA